MGEGEQGGRRREGKRGREKVKREILESLPHPN